MTELLFFLRLSPAIRTLNPTWLLIALNVKSSDSSIIIPLAPFNDFNLASFDVGGPSTQKIHTPFYWCFSNMGGNSITKSQTWALISHCGWYSILNSKNSVDQASFDLLTMALVKPIWWGLNFYDHMMALEVGTKPPNYHHQSVCQFLKFLGIVF